MNERTAIVIGATGLTGSYLVNELIKDGAFNHIKIFGRHPLPFDHYKIKYYKTDFSEDDFSVDLTGHVLFCCIGTTIKKAGSKAAFRRVDHDIPVMLSRLAMKNGIGRLIIISAIGANSNSPNFYLRTKGQMEEMVSSIYTKTLSILRPSMILGSRSEFRPGEEIGKFFMKIMKPILAGKLKKYRGIHAKDIAKAMIRISYMKYPLKIYESNEIAENS
jgi:uncharacterized protein YbjT (DUF2867 family)